MEERLWITKSKEKKYALEVVVIILAIWTGFELVTYLVEPTVMTLCKVRAESLGISISNKIVSEVMDDIGYLDLIILDRDEEGKILALRANVIEMNRISSEISVGMQEMYGTLEASYIEIPIGNFTGNSLLAGRGPTIKVKIIPMGTVSIDFKTEFISTGINQTRHRVYLEIISRMRVVAPFTSDTVEVANNVNVAETVLIGDVPSTFYNLEGVTDLATNDTLNMWD